MLRWTALMTLLAGCLAVASGTPEVCASPRGAGEDLESLVASNNAFALDLLKRLGRTDDNVLFSPSSIATALAMTSAGAAGVTEQEMVEVLHWELDRSRVHCAHGELLGSLKAESQAGLPGLTVASSLWGDQDFDFRTEFLDSIDRHYGASLRRVDFGADPEGARRIINSWVASETGSKVRELIQPGILSPSTTLVLAGALHFHAAWATSFDPKSTGEGSFTLSDGSEARAQFMKTTAVFPYRSEKEWKVLEIPYTGKRFSMVLVLPHRPDGIDALERSLTAGELQASLEGVEETRVHVIVPKFRLTASCDLARELPALGMKTAFTSEADFSRMAATGGLFIGSVPHQASIEVDEKGTEAAAATAVEIKRGGPVFRADHPFLFFIRDRETNAILLLGRLKDPSRLPSP